MQAEGLMDSPMTYSLFEFAKENGSDLVIIEAQPVAGVGSNFLTHTHSSCSQICAHTHTHVQASTGSAQPVKVKKEKKEQLSKSAKRKLAGRTSMLASN